MEYWVEENIATNHPNEEDKILVEQNIVLFENLKPIVEYLKHQDLLINWHFLRQCKNWKGRGNEPPDIFHIRFRVKTKESDLQKVRDYLTKGLGLLKEGGKISDHYRGNHGAPNDEYKGDKTDFDESATNPQGWNLTQQLLRIGSEIELIILSNKFQGIKLGDRFNQDTFLHLFANQCPLR